MDLFDKLRGIAYLGTDNIMASIRYGVERTLRRRPQPATRFDVPLSPPGPCQGFAPAPRGGRFRFHGTQLEVHFLAEDVVRLTWTPGKAPAPYLVEARSWPEIAVTPEQTGDGWRFATKEMVLEVGRDGAVTLRDPGGAVLRKERPPLTWSGRWVHRAALTPSEHCYGLGTRNVPLNLRGRTFRFWNTDPKGAYRFGQDPIYLCIPVLLGLHDAGSYLVFFENSHDGAMRLEGDAVTWFAGGALRYYLVPGPPVRALARYHDLTGKAPLPPRWALGFHQSRWSYMNEDDVLALVDGFRAHDLPLSAVHLDIHYMDGYRVFTADPERFPDLGRLAEALAQRNVALVAILDPGIKVDEAYPVYQEAMEKDLICRYPDDSPVVAPVWPGPCVFPDFTRAETRTWWGDLYRFFVDRGVDGVWHDMNEPAAFTPVGEPTLPRETRHDLDGATGDHVEAHNLYALLEARAGFEGLRRLRPGRRPWILSRAGCAGLQRYAWNWTGDNESTWDGLRLSIIHALQLGLSGIPYTGSDVGGFGGRPSPELFVRWLECAAFMPFFRVHSAFFTPPREPWAFGEPVLSIARRWLKQRQALLPYLYSLAWEAARNGSPLVRPLFWIDPHNRALWDVEDTFLLGDHLLVAPVLEPGARRRTIPLPRGRWYDFWSHESFDGPGAITLEAPLDHIPVLVRGGTVLPLDAAPRLLLHLYPGTDRTARGLRYDDPGDGYAIHRLERYDLHLREHALVLTRTVEGEFPFTYEGVDLVLHGATPTRARVDEKPAEVTDGVVRAAEFERVEWPDLFLEKS